MIGRSLHIALIALLATFRRKNRVFDVAVNGGAQRKRGRGGRRGVRQFERGPDGLWG